MVTWKSRRSNLLVVHSDKLKVYVSDTPSTWLPDGGGSETDVLGILVQIEPSGTDELMNKNCADTLKPRIPRRDANNDPVKSNVFEGSGSLLNTPIPRVSSRHAQHVNDNLSQMSYFRVCPIELM